MTKNFLNLHFKREYFIKLLIEIFSVIFAVILALLVNEWRQNNANRRIANNALKNVVQEIQENKAKVDSVLVKHKVLLPMIDSLKQVILTRTEDDTSEIGLSNISLEVLSNTAWTTIKSTDVINNMDFSKIMEISELYEVQSFYMQVVNKFMNDPLLIEIYTLPENEDFNIFKKQFIKIMNNLSGYLSRLIDMGDQLSEAYDVTLEQIGATQQKAIERK